MDDMKKVSSLFLSFNIYNSLIYPTHLLEQIVFSHNYILQLLPLLRVLFESIYSRFSLKFSSRNKLFYLTGRNETSN